MTERIEVRWTAERHCKACDGQGVRRVVHRVGWGPTSNNLRTVEVCLCVRTAPASEEKP